MPSKKLTSQKREELKRKKEKQQKSNFFLYLIIFIIVAIVGIAAIVYLMPGDESGEDGSSEPIANRAPTAIADYKVGEKNASLIEIDFLANDLDQDGDMFTLKNIDDPANGAVEVIDDIAYYTPDEDFTGVETFDYTIEDENGESTASTIHVIVADPEGNPIALIDTSMGKIVGELYYDKVPITAGNFITHSENGFYDGTTFHRVIPSFMVQGGDPLGDGSGGYAAEYRSGYGTPDNQNTWVLPDEFHDDLSNVRGTFSMANKGPPNTAGSQFFINIVDNLYLDFNKYRNDFGELIYENVEYPQDRSKHAVFGRVIDGMDVVDLISQVERDENDKPLNEVIVYSITIENN